MKKLFFLLLCTMLVLSMLMGSLVSCVGDNNKKPEETTAATPEEKPEETPEETPDENEVKYAEALVMLENGNYTGAYEAFKALGDYKDSQKYLSRFAYFPSLMIYDLEDRSGILAVTFDEHNLPFLSISDGSVGRKYSEITYDDKGNPIRQAVTYQGVLTAYDYTYDASYNMIKAEYSVDGVVSIVHDYTYNADGLLLGEVYTQEGEVLYDYTNTYDENGNLIGRDYNASGATYSYRFTYNADGNMINECAEDSRGNSYNVDYFYDEGGKLIREEYTEGDFSYVSVYTYDSVGNCIKEECTYFDETKDIITKEYDAAGNVTKEVHSEFDGTVITVETRYVLTYIPVDVCESSMKKIMEFFVVM